MSSVHDLLQTIERAIEHSGAAVPADTGSGNWQAVAFEQAGVPLLLDMAQVSEVLPLVHCTRLPGVKNWVVGISNVRGQILPIVDLGSYLEQTPARNNPSHRVLVLRSNDVELGVMVDRVHGMKQLVEGSKDASSDLSGVPEFIRPYCEEVLELEGNAFGVFQIEALLHNPAFRQIVIV